jgi:hypothetical protein
MSGRALPQRARNPALDAASRAPTDLTGRIAQCR